jgi:hypothetical protein
MANLHTEDTFMWENALIDDYDKDYAPGRRICIDDATPADWDALADKRLRARGVDTPQERSLKEMVENAEDLGLYDDPPKARDKMIGGDHYRQGGIQPIEYIYANNLGFCEANAVKYLTRWRYKDGMKDLEKAKHYIELLIELEGEGNGYNG